jgi:hypothetical protein
MKCSKENQKSQVKELIKQTFDRSAWKSQSESPASIKHNSDVVGFDKSAWKQLIDSRIV